MLIKLCSFFVVLVASAQLAMAYELLVTGYSGQITPLSFTPPSTLKRGISSAVNSTGVSPSWITFAKGVAYVTDESAPGRLYTVKDRRGAVEVLHGRVPTGGDGAVASCVTGDCIYVANYNSGSAAVLPIHMQQPSAPAKVFQYKRSSPGAGPVTTRQDHSYAHDATASPGGGWVYICDLGADAIHAIKTGKTCAEAKRGKDTIVPAGSGPRHLTFYGATAYLTSELSCTLTAFKHDEHSGSLIPIGEPIQATPPGTQLGGTLQDGPQRTTAEVQVTEKWVYVSTRGDAEEDHIAVYERKHGGGIAWKGWVGSGGRNPRHFSLSSDGAYLAVGHQDTGNVVIFALRSDGSLTKTAEAKGLGQVAFTGFVSHAHHHHGHKAWGV